LVFKPDGFYDLEYSGDGLKDIWGKYYQHRNFVIFKMLEEKSVRSGTNQGFIVIESSRIKNFSISD